MKDTRIVFMGTAEFSEATLKMLLSEGYNVVGVVSQPDRIVGRKKELQMTLVKKIALEHNIPVYQPEKLKNDIQPVLDMNPELIVTAAFGQMIPRAILECPKLGCVNVHASLLPKLRGGAPVHKSIIYGCDKTGITIMYMAVKMDAGDIIRQQAVEISDEMTAGVLFDELKIVGANLLKETLPSIIDQTCPRIKQNEEDASFAYNITREEEKVNWHKTAREVYNQIRGLNPWPGAYTTYKGKSIKLWSSTIHDCENAVKHHAHQQAGTIVKIFNDGIGVKVADGVIIVNEIQVEGKGKVLVSDYLRGNSIFEVDSQFE